MRMAYKLSLFITALVSISLIFFGMASYEVSKASLVESRTTDAVALLGFVSYEVKNPLYFLELGALNEIIQNINENPNIKSVYILDSSGKVITDGTDENKFYGQFLEDDFSKKCIQSDKQLVETGEDVLRVSYPIFISEKIGTIRCDFSLDELNQNLNNLLTTLTFFGIAINISVILLGIFLSRTIIKPIIRLRDTANDIGKGNLHVKIDVNSKDEIGELADAFTDMAKDLKEQQENLEKTVVERTKELSKNIDELKKYKKVTVGRELKMAEMKKEIKELKQKSQEGKIN